MLDEDIVKQVQELARKLEQSKHQQNSQPQPQPHTQTLLLKYKQQIRSLKSQLLQSTSNNINAIFHTELSESQCIFKQLNQLKKEIQRMQLEGRGTDRGRERGRDNGSSSGCGHQEKIKDLIRSYEEMLRLYHVHEKSVFELRNRQEENFTYFNSIKSEINNSVYQICSDYTNQRLSALQTHLKILTETLKNPPPSPPPPPISAPSRTPLPSPIPLSTQAQDLRIRQLLNQIANLNERLMQKQIQIEKMREANQELMMRSRALDRCQGELRKMRGIQEKVKEKDKRISQLETTIIEQMESKIRADSINSQQSDIEKQKNNIRNLKALVSDLRLQNKTLQTRLQTLQKQHRELKKIFSNPNSNNMTSESQMFNTIEKVNKDESNLKVVQDIVQVLVNAAQIQVEGEAKGKGKCKCLELTTDCLLSLNQEYPELQGILEELGVIAKTANLLPVHL